MDVRVITVVACTRWYLNGTNDVFSITTLITCMQSVHADKLILSQRLAAVFPMNFIGFCNTCLIHK